MIRNYLFVLFLIVISNAVFSQTNDSTKVSRHYNLGEIVVQSNSLQNVITEESTLKRNEINISQALKGFSSVVFAVIGGRNEQAILLRGFDTRKVPLYIDGIPVYISYDSYIDLARFSTFDYSKISISKGLTPIEYGANTLGGAINLVSEQPKEQLNIQLLLGMRTGKGYEYGTKISSKLDKFYFTGNIYSNQQAHFLLSRDYQPTEYEDGGKRENSYANDRKISLKAGYTPTENIELSINYINQKARKGNPPYSGNDEFQKTRFWQWPQWNKESIYLLSRIAINKNNRLKARLYYDCFDNQLRSFDDDSYTNQTKKYAFISIYNDYSRGGNVIFSNTGISNNTFNLSLHYKNDYHKGYNVGSSALSYSDYTTGIGIDDYYQLKKVKIELGAGFFTRKNIYADDTNEQKQVIRKNHNGSDDAFNFQLGATYSINTQSRLIGYVANRTRFANMKERYSYRLGCTIPNPNLNAENALHINLTYQAFLWKKILLETSIYHIALTDAIQQVNLKAQKVDQYQNVGKVNHSGLEIATNFIISNKIQWQNQYTLTNIKNKTNKDIYTQDVPKHKIYSNLQLLPFDNLEFNANAIYYSQRYSTTYGTIAQAFTTFSFYASYRYKSLRIYAGVKNVFDKDYAFSEGYPAEGRNFFTKVVYNVSVR